VKLTTKKSGSFIALYS